MFIIHWLNWLIEYVDRILTELPTHTANPVDAAVFLFFSGGWIAFVVAALIAFEHLWVEHIEEKWEHNQKYILLAIDVPRLNEQTPKAVENIFSTLWGTGGKPDFLEKYFIGKGANRMSFEIVSSEGSLQYYIRCNVKLRDLVEAAVYSQYPDAEIQEVTDYFAAFPKEWPNKEYDIRGMDLVLAADQEFPIKTYPLFEHQLVGEFMDPLASVIEAMNKVGPGENLFFQICVTPADASWKKKSEKLIDKIAGKPSKEEKKTGVFDMIIGVFEGALTEIFTTIFGGGAAKPAEKKDNAPRFMFTPIEREQLEALSVKASKVAFKSKVRLVYVAKRENTKGGARLGAMLAGLSTFAGQNINGFKPFGNSSVKTDYPWQKGMWAYYLSVAMYRPAPLRAFYLFHAAKNRSVSSIATPYILGVEELATLWHFPTIQIKSPLLRKIQSKRSEAPFNVPLGQVPVPAPTAPAMPPATPAAPRAPGSGEKSESVPPNLPFAS